MRLNEVHTPEEFASFASEIPRYMHAIRENLMPWQLGIFVFIVTLAFAVHMGKNIYSTGQMF